MSETKQLENEKPPLMLNHLNTGGSGLKRHWRSQILGTAVRDGKGWYKPQMKKRKRRA